MPAIIYILTAIVVVLSYIAFWGAVNEWTQKRK